MNSYLDQITPLIKMNTILDRSSFGIDDCNLIDEYLPETGFKLTFVYDCLKEYRKASITKAGLKDKVYSLRNDLHKHIDKRIYLLRHLSKINPNNSLVFESKAAPKIGRDPWLASLHLKGADKNALLAASLHVRDILFSASELEKIVLEKKQKFLLDLKKFIKILPSYLSLSKDLSLEESTKIEEAFGKLTSMIENDQLSEMKDYLSDIRHLLRHSAEKNLSTNPKMKEHA